MIEYHLCIEEFPSVGLAPTQIFGRFDGIVFDETKTYRKHTGDPKRRFGLALWLVKTLDCGGNLANRRSCSIAACLSKCRPTTTPAHPPKTKPFVVGKAAFGLNQVLKKFRSESERIFIQDNEEFYFY